MRDTTYVTRECHSCLRSVRWFRRESSFSFDRMGQESLVADGRTNNETLRHAKLNDKGATHFAMDACEIVRRFPGTICSNTRTLGIAILLGR